METLDGITEVLSHPQALAQCSGWLADTSPRSTAVADIVNGRGRPDGGWQSFPSRDRLPHRPEQEHGLDELAFP